MVDSLTKVKHTTRKRVLSRKILHEIINFDDLIERFKESTGLDSKKRIAESFGISPNSFSNQKKTGGIIDYFIKYGIKLNVNLNWLFTGEGEPLIKKEEDMDSKKYSDMVIEMQKEQILELRSRIKELEAHPTKTRSQKGSRSTR